MNRELKDIFYVVKYVAGILSAAYVVFVAVTFVFQKDFIYFPKRELIITPEKTGLPYEDVFFETSGGIKLNGWFVAGVPGGKTVLFCHGNADNISYFLDEVKQFNGMGFGVFIFDYRGYGRSGGKPCEAGIYLDAAAAWNWLIGSKRLLPADIIVVGRSLGGAVASHLAAEHKPGFLSVESAFTSIEDMSRIKYPFLPVKYLLKYHYRTVEHIRNVRCPVLVVHSREDKEVPFSQGLRIFQAANNPKEFLEIKGGHRDGFITSNEIYREGLTAFIGAN
ncbi:MAG: alpha/beta hydrolase [bacterium]